MELRQVGWLKQPAAKVRGPIAAGDQGSSRGHHCGQAARAAVGAVLVYFPLHDAIYTGKCVDCTWGCAVRRTAARCPLEPAGSRGVARLITGTNLHVPPA
jgi:hypothetical protein